MATEEDRQEERERLGNDPLNEPELTDEQLREESSLESPATPASGDPHAIEGKFEGADEYQAPSREKDQKEEEEEEEEEEEPAGLEGR